MADWTNVTQAGLTYWALCSLMPRIMAATDVIPIAHQDACAAVEASKKMKMHCEHWSLAPAPLPRRLDTLPEALRR